MPISKILITNIGFVPESLGGTEFYSYNLAKELVEQGMQVVVLSAIDDLSRKRYQVSRSSVDRIDVIKIANSHLHAREFKDFFVDETIDCLFEEILHEVRPDVVHFQHLANLSANLPEITARIGIPSVFTLHDYWMICPRSRLIRPGQGICSGPAAGVHCASCDDGVTPNPVAVPKYPSVVQFLNKPAVKKTAMKAMTLVSQDQISQVRSRLFGGVQAVPAEPNQQTIDDNRLRYETLKKQLSFPQLLISPSKYLKHRYESEGLDNILVMPLGFREVEPLHPLTYSDRLKLTFIGSVEPHKGVSKMLHALKESPELADKIELNIYGHPKDPIYAAKVKKLAQSFPIGVVNLHGSYRSDQDLRRIFANTHMTIFPSLWEENHPLVIREALLHGRPVIASNLGGVPEVIEHGINGLLFNPFQTGDLVNQLKLVIEEPHLLDSITAGARNSCIESLGDHVAKLQAIYDQIKVEQPSTSSMKESKELRRLEKEG